MKKFWSYFIVLLMIVVLTVIDISTYAMGDYDKYIEMKNSPYAGTIYKNAIEMYEKQFELENYLQTHGIVMYSLDGRSFKCPFDQVETYQNVGWYTKYEDVISVLYSPNEPYQITVYKAEVQTYLSLGWYTEPVVKLHSSDGREIVVYKYEVAAYNAVGWH